MWKPGQIVTVSGKKYRIIRKFKNCCSCDQLQTSTYREPCRTCLFGRQVPYNCRLQEIKPKSVMG